MTKRALHLKFAGALDLNMHLHCLLHYEFIFILLVFFVDDAETT